MRTPLFAFLVALLASDLSSGEPETVDRTGAAYSRERILPLVAEPGKSRKLFSHFRNTEKVTWEKKFWGASLGFDQFTGIGWGTARAGVLVTPEHVVCAQHYPINKGVHFYDAEGNFLGARHHAVNEQNKPLSVSVAPDIRVIRLSEPAPAGARIYPLPDPQTYQQRKEWGKLPISECPLLLATDWRNPAPKPKDGTKNKSKWRSTRSVHPVTLASFSSNERVITWKAGRLGNPAIDPAYHEPINLGDSGHPLFWVTKSGLALASTFTSTVSGPDYGNPDVQRDLQAAIDKLGGEKPYKLKTVSVP